jgi:hypothetical protein
MICRVSDRLRYTDIAAAVSTACTMAPAAKGLLEDGNGHFERWLGQIKHSQTTRKQPLELLASNNDSKARFELLLVRTDIRTGLPRTLFPTKIQQPGIGFNVPHVTARRDSRGHQVVWLAHWSEPRGGSIFWPTGQEERPAAAGQYGVMLFLPAGMTGFEPAISALTGQRVSPLHYTPERREVYHGARVVVKRNAVCAVRFAVCGMRYAVCAMRGAQRPG